MTIQAIQSGTRWVITPEGRIHAPEAREMEATLKRLLDENQTQLLVDFSLVTYVNSNTLKILLSALRRARKAGGDVQLASLAPRVHEIFEIAGMDRVFVIRERVEV